MLSEVLSINVQHILRSNKTTSTFICSTSKYCYCGAIIFFSPSPQDLPTKLNDSKKLNHLLLLHVHKDATEQIDLQEIVAEFIGRNERRKHCFGNIMRLLIF